MKTFAVLVLLVVACVSTSSALNCYSCTFPSDEKCKDAKGLTGITCPEIGPAEEVLGVKPGCIKAVATLNGEKSYNRGCTLFSSAIDPCAILGVLADECSICDTDLCNSSTHLLIKTWTLMLPIAIAMFMKFF